MQCESWHTRNLLGKLAGWKFRLELMLQSLVLILQDRTGQDRQAGKVSVSQSWALIPSSSENLSLVFYDLQLIG